MCVAAILLTCAESALALLNEAGKAGPEVLTGPAVSSALPSGVEVRHNNSVMQITAISDSVLRIRVSPSGKLPEDSSWAVQAEARRSAVEVNREDESGTVGFRTKSLRVSVELATMRLTIRDLAGNVIQQDDAERPIEFHGHDFRVYKTMPAEEHYFGLGDKPGPLDRRGHAFMMWNTDSYAFQESTDPIYKTIPFFMMFRKGRAAGVLFDNTFRSNFDFGKESPSLYSFGSEDGPIDYYVMGGPTPKDVLREYGWLTGYAPLPPMWALGYQQSRSSYYPESQAREIADHLRREHIPADVIYLDIEYQKDLRPFTVDRDRFPHFTQMLADLKKQDLRVVAITDPHIAALPNSGYSPFDSGAAGDNFLKNPDGKRYVGKVWPGDSVFPDFTRARTRAWWGSLYKGFADAGVAGFWNDMNEPAIFSPTKTMPDNVQHRIEEPGFAPRTADHREIHNIYGMQNSRATFDGLLQLRPDERPFVLTRATYAGGQRYAWTWTGDNASTWNHLRLTTPMLLNLGLSGFALSGADVGGFSGAPTPALLTKWFEIAAFEPLFREHSSRHTASREPWVDGSAEENIRRKYIEERYRLMPYIYTAAEDMSRTGVPIMRPLFVEFPKATADGHPMDLDAGSEFFFGPDLLVAPSPFPEETGSYEVKLPPGNWYDFWSGKQVRQDRRLPNASAKQHDQETKALMVQPDNSVLPVYVRGGAIVPMEPLTQSTMEARRGPLTLRVYPGADCRGSIYVDDGTSFAYGRGSFARVEYSCSVSAHGITVHIGRREGSFHVWWKQLNLEIYGMNAAPGVIHVSGAESSQVHGSFDGGTHAFHVLIPDSGNEQELELLR